MTHHCPECREDRPFEKVDCLDGHADCPERACVVCGFALVVGWLEVDAAPPPRHSHGAAA